ncbi:MAG: ABC-F family ATP-binding cassette domain-containing protein [Phycisphaerales bacterium]|nr:MAG: ABC-F family ATP-binding cassette domain-containing protein [Phycisphaerales bacterium]
MTAHNLTKQFGNQVVLENVSLELHTGEIAGLVGANGAGKTTLFRLVAGEIQPDKGTITRTRGLEIGFLRQEPDIGLEGTLRDEVGMAFAGLLALEDRLHDTAERMAACTDSSTLSALMETYERINAQFISAGGLRLETKLNEVLGGLGFAPPDYARPMSTLSGGQKCRAALARLLLGDQGFLLLDEPTNHLDIDAVRWLEKFLAGHRGGAVIISHDRYLLDRLCDRIIEIDRAKVANFPGNYSNYAKTKEIRLLTQQRQFQKDSEFIKKEQTFIAKYIAAQRTKQARGRRKRLERRLKAGEFVTEKPRAGRPPGFTFQKTRTEASTVLRCDQLGMRYDDNVLFTDLTFQAATGTRFGITGPNGTGKTTLLKIILGEVLPTSGSFALDPKLNLGYYAQEHTYPDPDRSIVQEIRAAFPELTEQDARSLLGRYLFSGDEVFKLLGSLSGGEQSRVRLAKLILQAPDVLILDEPTNHLDIPSLEVLEEALLEFPGMIIVVSHDRYLLDRVVDRLLVIRREGHALYDGNYSFYIEQVELQRTTDKAQQPTPRKKRKRGTAADRKAGAGPSPYDRLSIEEIEALILEYEAQLAALNERFGDPAVYKDRDALVELRREVNAVAEELADVDAAWQERVDTQ